MTVWDQVPLRRLFRIVNGGTPTSDLENWDGDVPWATPVDLGLYNGSIVTSTQRTLTEQGLSSGSAAVPGGSLLLSTRAPIGYVAQTISPIAFNQGCRGLIPLRPLDIRFYKYVLCSMGERLQASGQGSTFVELSSDTLASAVLPLVSIEAQGEIADFLDTETARIDALISKKRELIARLTEHRAGRIELAIRGLAATWSEVPLKFVVAAVTVGIVVTPAAWYAEDGIPALRGVNVKPGEILTDDIVHLSEEGHALHQKSALHAGDLVVVRTGQAGVAAVIPPNLDGANCIDLLIIRPGEQIVPEFLEFVLNSDWTLKHIEQNSVGTIQSHFNVASMKNLPVPSAPLEEQSTAVRYLTVMTKVIDKTVDKLNRQLLLLQEHRQALISAAVSGEHVIPKAAA